MLFSLIFTWIKYKMSPPSLIARNRLFVERDAKHRRITSNLGLTFRNSKWASYARTNVSSNAKSDFLSTLGRVISFLLIIILFFYGLHLYNEKATSNPLVLLYWFAMDSNLYLQIGFLSGGFYLVQLVLDYLHQKALVFFFGYPAQVTHGSASTPPRLRIPKRLHKPILHALLLQTHSSDTLDKLLDSNGGDFGPLGDLHFLKSLYLATYLTKLAFNPTPMIQLFNSLPESPGFSIRRPITLLNNVAKLRTPVFNSLTLDYLIFVIKPNLNVKSKKLYTRWSLTNISTNKRNELISSTPLNGLFYIPSITQNDLNSLTMFYPELAQLRTSLEDQMKAIRWDRWLYKYSLLHRSSLKTNFYLNAFKSSLSSGFYNKDAGTRNLWLPSSLSASKLTGNRSHRRSLHSVLYGRYSSLGLADSLPFSINFYNKANMEAFSFYESSYDWALKRFYNLNSTNTNNLLSKPLLKGIKLTLRTPYDSYTETLSNYDEDLKNNLSIRVNRSLLSYPTLVNSTSSRYTSSHRTASSQDPYLAYSTTPLFSKERLELLHNLSRNRSSGIACQNTQCLISERLLDKLPPVDL